MPEHTVFTIGLKALFDNYVESIFDITVDGGFDDGSNNFESAAPGLNALCTANREGIRKLFSEVYAGLLIPELLEMDRVDEIRIIDDLRGAKEVFMVLVGDEFDH
jgi:hypothetical protein